MKPRIKSPSGLLAILIVLVLSPASIAAQQTAAEARSKLLLSPADFRIEQRRDAGYHLFIRQKPGISSILLVESTTDPAKKADNFAYRDPGFHDTNGRERRILNAAFLPTGPGQYFLVDSSPEADAELGMAFHIFIPWVVDWGYSWSRSGQTFIHDGTFINVRTFAKPYADYSGPWLDNPFLVRVTQKPLPRPLARVVEPSPPPPPPPPPPPVAVPEPAPVVAPEPLAPPEAPPPAPKVEPKPDLSIYSPETVATFNEIAKAGEGEVRYAQDAADIVPKLASLLEHPKGRTLDLVFCLDTTDSMQDDIAAVKKSIPVMLAKEVKNYDGFRVALLLYKDYFEEYLVRRNDFTNDISVFAGELAAVRVGGGRDIPEAVYEALYSAITEYAWKAEDKKIILIGDAPPHPIPRGKVDKAMVDAAAKEIGVQLDVIILPN